MSIYSGIISKTFSSDAIVRIRSKDQLDDIMITILCITVRYQKSKEEEKNKKLHEKYFKKDPLMPRVFWKEINI